MWFSVKKGPRIYGLDFSCLRVIETKTIEKLCIFYKVSASYLLGHDGFIEYYEISKS